MLMHCFMYVTSKIIWLGDLNYRLASSGMEEVFKHLEKEDWQALLDKDQVYIYNYVKSWYRLIMYIIIKYIVGKR